MITIEYFIHFSNAQDNGGKWAGQCKNVLIVFLWQVETDLTAKIIKLLKLAIGNNGAAVNLVKIAEMSVCRDVNLPDTPEAAMGLMTLIAVEGR